MFDTAMAKGKLPSALCGFLELTIGGLIGEKDKYIYLRYVSKGEMQEDDYSITQWGSDAYMPFFKGKRKWDKCIFRDSKWFLGELNEYGDKIACKLYLCKLDGTENQQWFGIKLVWTPGVVFNFQSLPLCYEFYLLWLIKFHGKDQRQLCSFLGIWHPGR